MAEPKKREDKNNKTRILIVDDHAIVRFGIAQVINRQPDMIVCGEEENASLNRNRQAILLMASPFLVLAPADEIILTTSVFSHRSTIDASSVFQVRSDRLRPVRLTFI